MKTIILFFLILFPAVLKAQSSEISFVQQGSRANPDSNQFASPVLEPEMVFVHGGVFRMGNNKGSFDEKPEHEVWLSDFYIGKYEVTQRLWMQFMDSNYSHFQDNPELPAENVAWDEIQVFIEKLNAATGKSYRLPTEAEWEYAARGGKRMSSVSTPDSNALLEVAWFSKNSGNRCHPVGLKQPNQLGLHDMLGNVSEWCNDWHMHEAYSLYPEPLINPQGPDFTGYKCVRGGDWESKPQFCGNFCRKGFVFNYANTAFGFRLALPAE